MRWTFSLYKSLGLFLILTSTAIAETSSSEDCAPWQCQGILQVVSGVILPISPLDQFIDPSPIVGVALQFNYYQNIVMDLRGQYSRVEAVNSKSEPLPLHLILIEAGYALKYWGKWGAGLGMHFLRAREELQSPMLLEDNESDFGNYFRYTSPGISLSKIHLAISVSQWSVWTKPELSHFWGVQLEGGFELW